MSFQRKFDVHAYRMSQFLPPKIRPYYFGINAFFLEILKSREISRERSIAQTRLHWWVQTLNDVESGKRPREPVGRVL